MRMSIYDPFPNWARFADQLSRRSDATFLSPRRKRILGNRPADSMVNVHETANEFLLTVDVPGVEPESIELTAKNSVLTIKERRSLPQAEVKAANEQGGRREFGICTSSFLIPENVDVDRIEARAKYGVLEVTMPKASQSPLIKIPVKS